MSDKAEEAIISPFPVFSVDEQKLAAKPSTTGVVIELTDKEMRVMNKKIKEEVLQKITQCKAVLSVPYAFGMEHWKVLLSQMENGGDYTISCSLASPMLVKTGGVKPL